MPTIFHCEPDRLLDDTLQVPIEGSEIHVTNAPRTPEDGFRHRRGIGMDVVIQALKEAVRHRPCTPAGMASAAQKQTQWKAVLRKTSAVPTLDLERVIPDLAGAIRGFLDIP